MHERLWRLFEIVAITTGYLHNQDWQWGDRWTSGADLRPQRRVSEKVEVSVYPTASLSISELLSGPYLLNIPIFQRPYSWGREQAEQLLDDLIEAAGIGFEGEADRDYFLGAVVLMDAPGIETRRLSPKMSQREFGVIDGQQRLVTIMTLLAVLRDLEADPRTSVARRVQTMLLAQQGSRFFRTERFRLHLSGRERAVFEENILQSGSTEVAVEVAGASLQETSLLDVRDRFRATLQELPPGTRKVLAEFVAERCYVVAIVGTDIDRSHQMFVVLNERGKKLQRNDILKSDILSRLATGDIAWAARMWDDMSLALGDDFEPFFGHLRTIFGYGRLPIVSGVRTIIREAGGSEAFFKEVFLPYSKAYNLIRSNGENVLPPTCSEFSATSIVCRIRTGRLRPSWHSTSGSRSLRGRLSFWRRSSGSPC